MVSRRRLVKLAPFLLCGVFFVLILLVVQNRSSSGSSLLASLSSLQGLQRFQRDWGVDSPGEDPQTATDSLIPKGVNATVSSINSQTDLHELRHFFDKRRSINASRRSSASHPLFPGYVIKNSNLCQSDKVDILIYLHSSAENQVRRSAIRQSWGSTHTFTDINVKLLFILGRPADSQLQLRVLTEAASHGDIVQGNFQDTFKNLTYKALTMLAWVNEHCSQGKFLVKADDDIFVDIFRVVRDLIPKTADKPFAAICDHKEDMEIVRQKNSRWYVSEEVLPNRKNWPPFCPGYFTVFSGDLVPVLYEKSFSSKVLIPTDDTYVFGLLVEQNVNISVYNLHGLIVANRRPNPPEELKANGKFEYVAFGVASETDHQTFWTARLMKLSAWEQTHSSYYKNVPQNDPLIIT